MNQQETVSNVETLKACMILITNGAMDSKTIRQALVAFTLMERYLVHFEDNYRSVYTQAAKQTIRDEIAAANAAAATNKGASPQKQRETNSTNYDNTGSLPVFNKS